MTAPRERGGLRFRCYALTRSVQSRLLLRLGFFLLLAGGLLLWSELRRPRDLGLDVDLTGALPGDIAEVDLTVSRDGHALLRFEQRYGSAGAPGTLHVVVHARPGPAEVDVMLIDARGNARRVRTTVELRKEESAILKAS